MNESIEFPIDKRYRWYKETMMSAVYHGQTYEVIFDGNYDVHLYSEQPINKLSYQDEKGFYETVVPMEELTAVYADRLYAEYKGLIFPLGYVDENFSNMDLIKENSYIDTTELGFQFSNFYHGGYLTVKKEQISRLLAKRSVRPLDELIKKKRKYWGQRSKTIKKQKQIRRDCTTSWEQYVKSS